MTFSILATDGLGGIGVAISSSSPAVAARCVFLKCGVGGAVSQNLTDPRLGDALVKALEEGMDAQVALDHVVDESSGSAYRQLMVMDASGAAAHFSGESSLDIYAAFSGSSAIAAGNLLGSAEVPREMVRAFESEAGELEVRLVKALHAGLRAGGERQAVRSAGVAVVRSSGWAETDLRVDWHAEPIHELTTLLERWLPLRGDYVARGLDPVHAPLGDLPDR